jgi:DNA helicase II / ATP-dependent DNA helicase PcrA
MNNILDNLNPQQKKAVTADLGQVLVLAGPGSGKTRVLTLRVAYLILTLGVRPANILAVTFTNKAAREMENRLSTLLGEKIQGIWLGTFHATCARLLRRESGLLPFTSNFVIFDSDDQENLVKRALKDLNIDDKVNRPASMLSAISQAKNNLVLPNNYPTRSYREEIVSRVYKRYQTLLQTCNAVDFDDLLLYAVRVLEENPPVKEKYARRFEHVLVDEFQDTNTAQYRLLQLLCGFHNNIFVVGDEDQSIYRWRGADYKNVLRFEDDYPDSQKVLLEQNYRSTQNVLDAARAVIDRNQYRTPKKLFSERGAGDKIILYEAVDDHAEASYVVDTIQGLTSGGKGRGGDIAVMYRTNAQSRLLEEAFLRSGMAYRLVGAQRFYGRREVKDMIAYLRMVQNPADEVSLGRVINVPPRGIGGKTLDNLLATARVANTSAGEVLIDLATKGPDSAYAKSFSGRSATLLADFGSRLVAWQEAGASLALPALFDRIAGDIGYREYIEDASEEGQDRWGNVEELRRLAYEYQEKGLTAFLENLALVSDQDTIPERSDSPTLLTLHAAKGLEFSIVIIIGLDEGLLPHSRSRDDPEEMAEERRLFYVGLTRAKNNLYLVRAERRSTFGSFEASESSRFLDDIPAALIRHMGGNYKERRAASSSWEQPARWEGTRLAPPGGAPSFSSSKKIERRFKPAMHVRHPVWGEGIVLDSAIRDGEEEVDVHFVTVGFKRLLASLAKLELV